MNNERREFIKSACSLCAAVVGIGALLPAVSACATLPNLSVEPTDGFIPVQRNLFTAENQLVIVHSKKREFDLVLVQQASSQFQAFELQCTHQPNPLIVTKSGFHCNAHGSAFSLDGSVKKSPALKPLKTFPVRVTDDFVYITL